MARIYYTLCIREFDTGVWSAEFGDYDRECVAFELDDMAQHQHKRKNMKIIKSAPTQKAINEAVTKLNGFALPDGVN